MRNKITLLLVLFFSLSNICFSQSGWFLQLNMSGEYFYGVDFINSSTGIVVGNYVVMKTINGGNNWFQINQGISTYPLMCIKMCDSSNVLIGSEFGTFLKTTNGGTNWILINLGFASHINDIFFITRDTVFAVGKYNYGGYIFKSTNGGTNWMASGFSVGFDNTDFKCICFTSASVGYIASASNNGPPGFQTEGEILKTTNGGDNWFIQFTSTNNSAYDIFFMNSLTGFAGLNNSTLKTTNGGTNWILVGGGSCTPERMNFRNLLLGYAVGYTGSSGTNYTIMNTTNGGISWQIQMSSTYDTYNDLCFTNDNTGWVVSGGFLYGGKIFKTTTGGTTGINNITGDIPVHFSLSQNYPNPFNPVTRIKFDLPKSSNVKLVIYDVLGREIETIVNDNKKAGTYEVDWDGNNYASGVYFYKLVTDEYTETKKMVLIK